MSNNKRFPVQSRGTNYACQFLVDSFQCDNLFSYNLVLPDVLVVLCWTESQDKLAKGTLSGCDSLWVRPLLLSVLLSLS